MSHSCIAHVIKWDLIIGTTLPTTACAGQMLGGSGYVRDSVTRLPIPNATVTLECRRTKLYGSEKVREVVVTTDNAGKYSFSFADVLGCDFAYVHAANPGYRESGSIHVGYGYSSYGSIPEERFLTPISEVIMLRLQYLSIPLKATFSSKQNEYLSIYQSFFESKRIAASPREKVFVAENYCDRLKILYADLSDEDSASLRQYSVHYAWNNASDTRKIDHENEVIGYCRERN